MISNMMQDEVKLAITPRRKILKQSFISKSKLINKTGLIIF